MDDALEMLKRSVHNHHSVNTQSRSSQKTARSVSFAADSLSAVDIRTASIINSPSNSIKSSADPTAVMQKVESDIKDLKTTMAETQEQMAKLMELLTQRSRARSPSPNGPCYHCNEVGHIAQNCPKLRSPSPSPSRDSTSNKLVNMLGLEWEAATQPRQTLAQTISRHHLTMFAHQPQLVLLRPVLNLNLQVLHQHLQKYAKLQLGQLLVPLKVTLW